MNSLSVNIIYPTCIFIFKTYDNSLTKANYAELHFYF